MGVECLCFTYFMGLVALFYGIYVLVVGQVYLTSWSKELVRGEKAKLAGFILILSSIIYYAITLWAWSFYDR
jgi:hypothetical protein